MSERGFFVTGAIHDEAREALFFGGARAVAPQAEPRYGSIVTFYGGQFYVEETTARVKELFDDALDSDLIELVAAGNRQPAYVLKEEVIAWEACEIGS